MGTTKTSEGPAGERRLFSVREYQQMYAAGVLGEDDRVELIEGEVVKMSPIGPRHAAFPEVALEVGEIMG